MAGVQKSNRFAHCDGHLDVCYDESGDCLITGGPDGDVRIYAGFEDDDPITHSPGEVVYAVAFKNGRFYTGCDDNAIQAHTFKEGSADGLITRFTAPVTHICFNQDGTKLLAGSSDFTVKVVDVESSEQKIFQGHEAPVLSVAFHPKETQIASSSCDGTVKVWNTVDQTVIKTISGLPKTNDFSSTQTLCRLTWDKEAQYLVVPIEKEVKVFNASTWQEEFSLTDASIKELISIVCFSPCGKYLAGACRDGTVVIWNFKTKKCLTSEPHQKKLTITGLVWNPKANRELAYVDNGGELGLLENVVPAPGGQGQGQSGVKVSAVDSNYASLDLFDDDDDDMLIQATNPDVLGTQDAAGDNSDDDDDDMPKTPHGRKQVTRIIDDDDDNSRDTDAGSMQPPTLEDGDDAASVTGAPAVAPPKPVIVQQGYEPTPLQRPFQAGSSPAHLEHRYMVWNSVGIIVQYNTEEEQSINIEFHDTATHHAMHVSNMLNHTMADLSSDAALLACESDADEPDETPSKLVCMHFSSWDNCKEWTTAMPAGENVVAVTIGDGWVAAATDKRLVRMFTLAGIQKEVFNVPGPVVAMAAHTNQLAIAYHKAMGIPGDQCLGLKLLYVTGKRKHIISGDSLPLTFKSILSWIGFSAEGTPFTMDTAGVVRMLNRGFANTWTEVANTKKHCKGKSDNFFIVGIHENPQQLRAVKCKGARYPPTLPRPTVQLLPFQLPMCEQSTDKGTMEESYWRSLLFSQHLDWWSTQGFEYDETAKSQSLMPQQEALMKLFALACKSEREFRAVEICELMPNQHTVQLAIKYASRLRLLNLAQKLSDVARQKAEEELAKMQQQAEEEEEEEEEGDFRSKLEAGYSHTVTEWSSKNTAPDSFTTTLAKRAARRQEEGEEGEEVEEAEKSIYEEIEEEQMETEEAKPSGPMLNLKQRKPKEVMQKPLSQAGVRNNPFKSGTQKTPTQVKGTSVFDSIERPQRSSNKEINKSPLDKFITSSKTKVMKKGSMQTKLFASKKTEADPQSENKSPSTKSKKSGFQLWFEVTRVEFEGEHPDLSEADLTVLAAKRFKELPADQKQEWLDKAKGSSTTPVDDGKKRKREETSDLDNKTSSKLAKKTGNETITQQKQALSENTSSKLSTFSFNK